jgi:S-DNA-T family DNA segregation ATPase FtsK/SpoIIIE
MADLSYFTLGFSAWWCFAAGRARLDGHAGTLDARQCAGRACCSASAGSAAHAAFWIGLAVLLCASTALEWSRLVPL